MKDNNEVFFAMRYTFKTKVKSLYEPLVQNKLYCHGHGLSKVNHCRIRLGLSHLNSHLHHYNLIDSPSCSNPECGRTPEEPRNLQRIIFLVVPDTTTKDAYSSKVYHVSYFQT